MVMILKLSFSIVKQQNACSNAYINDYFVLHSRNPHFYTFFFYATYTLNHLHSLLINGAME